MAYDRNRVSYVNKHLLLASSQTTSLRQCDIQGALARRAKSTGTLCTSLRATLAVSSVTDRVEYSSIWTALRKAAAETMAVAISPMLSKSFCLMFDSSDGKAVGSRMTKAQRASSVECPASAETSSNGITLQDSETLTMTEFTMGPATFAMAAAKICILSVLRCQNEQLETVMVTFPVTPLRRSDVKSARVLVVEVFSGLEVVEADVC